MPFYLRVFLSTVQLLLTDRCADRAVILKHHPPAGYLREPSPVSTRRLLLCTRLCWRRRERIHQRRTASTSTSCRSCRRSSSSSPRASDPWSSSGGFGSTGTVCAGLPRRRRL